MRCSRAACSGRPTLKTTYTLSLTRRCATWPTPRQAPPGGASSTAGRSRRWRRKAPPLRCSRATSPTPGLEHLHVNLGRAHELAGEWEKAEKTYEEMLAGAKEVRDPRLECAALNHLAVLAAQRRSDMRRAEVLLRESLEAAEASGDRPALAETKWNLAQMAAMRGDPETAISHSERALDLAREAGLKELEARSLFVLGQAYRFAGRWEECVAYTSRAAALYRALSDAPA